MVSVFILLFLCFYSSITQSLKPLSYQVHSWNDLNLWTNGFRQGMTHMKIDANYVEDETFCNNQQRVTSNTTNGCFLYLMMSPHDQGNTTRQMMSCNSFNPTATCSMHHSIQSSSQFVSSSIIQTHAIHPPSQPNGSRKLQN